MSDVLQELDCLLEGGLEGKREEVEK